jgi:hypothetical protein
MWADPYKSGEEGGKLRAECLERPAHLGFDGLDRKTQGVGDFRVCEAAVAAECKDETTAFR